MSKIQSSPLKGYPFLTTFLLTLISMPSVFVSAQTPRPGEVKRLHAITLSLQAGGTEKETKRVTYTPPPGWYVRSHVVHCAKKTGQSSYSVSTVPQDWGWSSEEKVEESYKTLIDLAEKSGDKGLQARFAVEQSKALGELRKVRSTHHALVVDATAKGDGFLRGNGCLDLTVTAELVYVGTNDNLEETIARLKKALNRSQDKASPVYDIPPPPPMPKTVKTLTATATK